MPHPIGIFYEHPQWFTPLFAELDRRGVAYDPIDAADPGFDPARRLGPYELVLNRMSPSAWTRGNGAAIAVAGDYLQRLGEQGTPVVNGSGAFAYETSKARQLELFAGLGVRFPRSTPVSDPSQLAPASDGLEFPVLIKPNLGGSGAGMRSFADRDQLEAAVAAGELDDLGPDGAALLQEHLPAEGESIVRIEILGGEFLYAIRIQLMPGSFNLCPADYCELPGIADGVSGRGLPIEGYHPPQAVIDDARRIVAGAGMDLGGVEYLVNAGDGHPYFYDVNALSNFVADAPKVIGFDPFVDLVDFLLERAGLEGAVARP
jgi:hypothetical protein